MKLIIGITGASGAIIAIELLKRLKDIKTVEVHLIITAGAELTIRTETNFSSSEVRSLADYVYDVNELDASLASGSFQIDGMIIVPCSMKTLAGIASGYCENLLLRAADVCLKENRKLLLVPRETPFSRIHLRNMKELSDCGVIILPPIMTFYNSSKNLDAQILHIVNKILRLFELPNNMIEWHGKIKKA